MAKKKKPELHQRMFKATVYFTVDEADVGQPVTVDEIKDFLEDALVVDVDFEEYGNPIALQSVVVNLDSLEKIEPNTEN